MAGGELGGLSSRLEASASRYAEIESSLQDPAIAGDLKRYSALAKERRALGPLIKAYEAHQKVQKELAGHRTLLESERDPEIRELAKAEIPDLEGEAERLVKDLKVLLLPKDPLDEKNILLEIRAGTGGDEAALFAADLFRMYSRFAERRGWKVELLSASETGLRGFKEVIALISGDGVYSALKYESGTHRVQRVPQTEASGRIHTSAITVAVMPEADDVEIDIAEKDLRIDVFRSGGHGGQSVNTTDSAVRVTHLPTNLSVICQDEKSQHKNKAKALKILKSRLLEAERKRAEDERARLRKSQVGSGDRSEKIRTYNFPQNRITDHRIQLTLHQLDAVLDGDLEELVAALRADREAEALKGVEE